MKESDYLHGRTDLVKKLQDFPFLQNLDADHLLNILQLSKLRTYDEGEVITK